VPRTQIVINNVADRASDQTHTFEQCARRTQRQITGIPVRSGRLERGVRGGSSEAVIEAGPWGFALITTVPYSRYVFDDFHGRRGRPPKIPRSVGPDTAAAVAADINRR
jgi:hypothetical protein